MGLAVITNADHQPDKETIAYNDDLLTWMGVRSRYNYGLFYLVIIATLIALIVAGSILVIYNAFAISIGERKKQFGMFASVGATAAQIRRIGADRSRGHRGDRHPVGHPGCHRRGRDPAETHPGDRRRVNQ